MIELQHVSKTFENAGGRVDALRDVSLTIADGDIYGIIGMSGAGKSTLVRCINMLERPTEGRVIVNGQQLDAMTPAQLRAARREITMIFQRFNLLMQRTCLQNICFPMELAGVGRKEAQAKARQLLELVGLPDKAQAYPAQLSGGQQQRIAIARALATNPKVLLCDEATSALDPKTTRQILELIQDINRKLGITVVVICLLLHISEPTRLLSISYAVFCLKKKKKRKKRKRKMKKFNVKILHEPYSAVSPHNKSSTHTNDTG